MKFTKITPTIFVRNEEDREKTILFLKQEAEMDAKNYQEMLNVVDMTTLTKGKITALGKLGNQYKKASATLIKKYKNMKLNTLMGKEHTWITK